MSVQINGKTVFNDSDINNPDINGGTADDIVIGETTPVKGTFDDLEVFKDINDGTGFIVKNPNIGNAARSTFAIGTTPAGIPWDALFFEHYGSGYTAAGLRKPSSAAMIAGIGATNGLSIGTDYAAPLNFFTNTLGSGADMILDQDGNLELVDGTLDLNGNYAIDMQNIQDLALKGPKCQIDGDGTSRMYTAIDDAYNDFTWIVGFNTSALATGTLNALANSYRYYSGPDQRGAYLSHKTENLRVAIYNSAAWGMDPYGYSINKSNVSDNTNHVVALISNNTGGLFSALLDGRLLETRVIKTDPMADPNARIKFGVRSTQVADRWNGAISFFYQFNLPIEISEAREYSDGPIEFKYLGASQTVLTSGVLIFGKHYTIDTFVAGDDFTNVGGVNTSGTSFVATGDTPTVWTNGSSLRQTGCIRQYEPAGLGHKQWVDISGNELHGTVLQATPIGLPANHIERYRHSVAITGDTAWTDIVPAGYILETLILNNSGIGVCTLDLGTTSGTFDVFQNQAVAASGITNIPINEMFSESAAQSLYLNDDSTPGWTNVSITATLLMRRVV